MHARSRSKKDYVPSQGGGGQKNVFKIKPGWGCHSFAWKTKKEANRRVELVPIVQERQNSPDGYVGDSASVHNHFY